MDWTHYRFLSVWPLPAAPATVYPVLERVEDYPRWWPQVRSVTRLDDTAGLITIRSLLPYALTFTAREVRRDPEAGVLHSAFTGDVEGWARWTVTAGGPGTLARYEQVVDVCKPLLRRLALPGRPLFRANHRLMMRAGRHGLATYLETV
ncbi:SRPBCC family protein [Streptomyces sp. NPDC028635]|uniref:SRPBCC family protein n=1 Tax=Streptomyces sp. NPDC028635 TaxID=3154800 RepID=UPI0033FE8728